LLKQRIFTAIILAPAVIGAIFYLPLNYFAAFFLAVLTIGAWEWGPLMGFADTSRRLAFVAASILLMGGLWYCFPPLEIWTEQGVLQDNIIAVLWLAVAWWALSAVMTILYPKYSKLWSNHRSVRGIFGWLTLVPTWLAFMVLRSSEYQWNVFQGAHLIMFLFLMVWGADIGAYFVGKAFGKHKLMPNVSPGKTIEGYLGGVACSAVLVSLAGYIIGWQTDQYALFLTISFIITTVSVLGDLNESMFKRQAGIKDSGTILPGHGGILDRIDSLTATAPIYALCFALVGW
jgi:phosphatidate cytidylyltransferase